MPVVAAHVLLFTLIMSRAPTPPETFDTPAVTATLFRPAEPPPPPPPPEPSESPEPPEEKKAEPAAAGPKTPTPPTPPRTTVTVRQPRTPPPPDTPTIAARPGPPEPDVVLGEAALAGATTAGFGSGSGGDGAGGGGGGSCDMVRRLQDALRKDPEVRTAVSSAHRPLGGGKAILIWDGEWMRSPGQEGKGLAGVRQAIAMEVAFAPDACKARPMRGLVVISFADSPGAPKLALGGGDWRWTELLSARR